MLKTRLLILAASGLLALAAQPRAAQAQYYGGYGRFYGPGPRVGWPGGYGYAGYPRPYGYPYGFYPRPFYPRPVFVPSPYAYAPPPPVVYAPPPVYAPASVYVVPRPVIHRGVAVRRRTVRRVSQPGCLCGTATPARTIPSPLIGPLPGLRPAPSAAPTPPAVNSYPPEHGS